MKVIITKNPQEMSAKAARFVLSKIWQKPNLNLALPTGKTPVQMYKHLVESYKNKSVDFSKITTFNLDEYVGLPASSKQSYAYFMQRAVFDHINVPKNNINIPNGSVGNVSREANLYEDKIKKAGGLDLAVLGIGRNAHIGFCEPGTAFDSKTHVANLSRNTLEVNKKYFKNDEIPKSAITMGLGTIMSAKQVVLMAYGKSKAKAVAQAIEGPINKYAPASVLQAHPNVTFIIDKEAASLLKHSYVSPFLFNEGDVELLTEKDLPRSKKVAIISPHPDDASISVGGVISSLSQAKNFVSVIIMSTGYRSVVGQEDKESVIKIREAEAKNESEILGSKPVFLRGEFYDAKDQKKAIKNDTKKLVKIFKKIKPNIVLLPQINDSHPTHSASREIAINSISQLNSKIQLWYYEGLWSLFSEGDFNTIFSFNEKIMKIKMRAIASQKSQISRTRFDIAAKSLAQLRAAIVPEQALVGYGAKAPKLGKYFELFFVKENK